MIRFKLKELIAEKSFQEGRRVTIEEISKSTGIHRTTLSKLSNIKGYNASTDVLDKLCAFFDVKISDVAVFIKDE
ncbi:helix-turn-helix transcriptional regulator [Colwellia sp. PAMC 21821]|uniref:helix-turn-helix domain-containing protein n=1 Tax=Colwellia sp. PAMC 21821 TaxID=1816219 RepID=UPI0009BE242F|nr:helix-turn-helix transcriptional regulator [Colwellia sp. PAMC 21821]ARD45903.1 transcriptional regulator [Colwellia sp. PAMC 21821]